MHASWFDSDVHSCFQLSSWIRHYINVMNILPVGVSDHWSLTSWCLTIDVLPVGRTDH